MLNKKYFDTKTKRMTIEGYKAIYEAIEAMSIDADSFGLFEQISDADVEKCKWIAAIAAILNDVPQTRMEHTFKQRNIEFDLEDFMEENDLLQFLEWYSFVPPHTIPDDIINT